MNDVAATMLITLEQNLAYRCTEAISRHVLNDFLQLPFDEGLVPLFYMTFFLLAKADKDLYMLVSDDGL